MQGKIRKKRKIYLTDQFFKRKNIRRNDNFCRQSIPDWDNPGRKRIFGSIAFNNNWYRKFKTVVTKTEMNRQSEEVV